MVHGSNQEDIQEHTTDPVIRVHILIHVGNSESFLFIFLPCDVDILLDIINQILIKISSVVPVRCLQCCSVTDVCEISGC